PHRLHDRPRDLHRVRHKPLRQAEARETLTVNAITTSAAQGCVAGARALAGVPSEITDPVNARILAVSEDRIVGFVNEPFAQIAFGAELAEEVVVERLRAMLSSGVIRRIRQ